MGHAARLAPSAVRGAHLFVLLHDVVEDGLVCRVLKAALCAGLLVFLVSDAESFGTEVKGVAKWLVDALQCFPLSHEDLVGGSVVEVADRLCSWEITHSLECRRACSRVSSHEDGLVGHGCGCGLGWF